MANTKISELTNLGTTPANVDVLPIVDVSTSTTKKVTVSDLLSGVSAGFDPNVDNPAIGNGASAGTDSVSIGHDAIGSGASTVLIGQNADGGANTRATAIGSDVTVTGADATAYGHDARAAAGATGIGVESRADGSLAAAVGYLAEAKASSSIAIGYNSDCASIAEFSIAIGRQASTANDDAIAIGYLAAGNAVDATAVGTGAVAGGSKDVAIGANVLVNGTSGFQNTAIGSDVTFGSSTQNNIAIGHGVAVPNNSVGNIYIGYEASSGAFNGEVIAIGYQTTASGDQQVSIGNQASGSYGVSVGHRTSGGTYSTSVGHESQATGNYGIGIGRTARANFANTIHMNATSGSTTNAPTADGHIVIETDDAKIEYSGNWDMSGGTLTLGAVTYPNTDGTAGQVLQTDGAGNLSFATAGGGFDPNVDNPAVGNGASTGTNSSAYGHDASATGTSGVAVGYQSTANGTGAVSLGFIANGGANNQAITIGQQSAVSSTGGIAVGYFAKGAFNAVGIGVGADATGSSSISIGDNSEATATNAVSIGNDSQAVTTNAVAIGNSSSANGASSVCLGHDAHTTAANTIHINASGLTANAPATAGHMVIETDDAKIEYDGAWSMTGGNFEIYNSTAPTTSVTDGVILYAEDVSASSELKVRDEAGNVTTLSPHNFELIPEGPSEDMAWSYYSEKDGKRINVDMLKAIRVLERMSGEQLVFEG